MARRQPTLRVLRGFVYRAKIQRPQRAGFHANRFLAFRHPVMAQPVALGHMTFGRVGLRRAVLSRP